MNSKQNLIQKILSGKSDKNINLNDLRNLLLKLGFEERVKGSHHLFRNKEIPERVNLQKDRNKAKAYQI